MVRVLTSHTVTLWSTVATAMLVPHGDHARSYTSPWCLSATRGGFLSDSRARQYAAAAVAEPWWCAGAVHSRTPPPSPPAASVAPFGDHRTTLAAPSMPFSSARNCGLAVPSSVAARFHTRTSSSAPPVAKMFAPGCRSTLKTGAFLPPTPPWYVISGVAIFMAMVAEAPPEQEVGRALGRSGATASVF